MRLISTTDIFKAAYTRQTVTLLQSRCPSLFKAAYTRQTEIKDLRFVKTVFKAAYTRQTQATDPAIQQQDFKAAYTRQTVTRQVSSETRTLQSRVHAANELKNGFAAAVDSSKPRTRGKQVYLNSEKVYKSSKPRTRGKQFLN